MFQGVRRFSANRYCIVGVDYLGVDSNLERAMNMSFRERFIFRIDMWHIRLLAILISVSASATAALALTPSDAVEAADKLAGMNVTQLMALICVVSTGFAAWLFYTMSKTAQINAEAHIKTAVALEGLSTELKGRPCITPRVHHDL